MEKSIDPDQTPGSVCQCLFYVTLDINELKLFELGSMGIRARRILGYSI